MSSFLSILKNHLKTPTVVNDGKSVTVLLKSATSQLKEYPNTRSNCLQDNQLIELLISVQNTEA